MLKSIINNDSNTSNPPSTDQKPSADAERADEYNGRGCTKRRAGAQKGHHGCTMTADEVRVKSGSCCHEVMDIGDASSGKSMVPEEYRSCVTYGPNIRAVAMDLYREGVMSNDRIAGFINALGGGRLRLSEGSVYNFCRESSRNAPATVAALEEELLGSSVVMTDAATSTGDGTQHYMRDFSIWNTVVYRAMNRARKDAIKKCVKLFSEEALIRYGPRYAQMIRAEPQ